jgi:RhoGEF domain
MNCQVGGNCRKQFQSPLGPHFEDPVNFYDLFNLLNQLILGPFLQSISTQHNPDSLRKRYLIQLINREQHFISAMNFGVDRFVTQLKERKDLISTNDHRTLFQNVDELLQLSEDILEQLLQNDHDPQIHFASRVYLSKSMAICAGYKKYCNGLKRADCVLVMKRIR